MRISDWSSDVCSSDLYRLAAWNRGLQRICAPDYGLRSYRGPLRRYECRQGTLQFLQAGRPWHASQVFAKGVRDFILSITDGVEFYFHCGEPNFLRGRLLRHSPEHTRIIG